MEVLPFRDREKDASGVTLIVNTNDEWMHLDAGPSHTSEHISKALTLVRAWGLEPVNPDDEQHDDDFTEGNARRIWLTWARGKELDINFIAHITVEAA